MNEKEKKRLEAKGWKKEHIEKWLKGIEDLKTWRLENCLRGAMILAKEKQLSREKIKDFKTTEEIENLTQFELSLIKCTLENHYCGMKTKEGFCKQIYCKYQAIQQKELFKSSNDKGTVQLIREIEKKHDRILTSREILAMTSKDEIKTEVWRDEEGKLRIDTFIIDKAGSVFNLRKHRVIRQNW